MRPGVNRSLSAVYTPQQKSIVEYAASIKAMPVGTFIRTSVMEAAEKIVSQRQQPYLQQAA